MLRPIYPSSRFSSSHTAAMLNACHQSRPPLRCQWIVFETWCARIHVFPGSNPLDIPTNPKTISRFQFGVTAGSGKPCVTNATLERIRINRLNWTWPSLLSNIFASGNGFNAPSLLSRLTMLLGKEVYQESFNPSALKFCGGSSSQKKVQYAKFSAQKLRWSKKMGE